MTAQRQAKIFPHLWYAKDAEAAARLYTSIFTDSRIDGTWTLPTESPSGPEGSVTIVDFTLFGQPFQAMTAGPHHEFNDAISMVVVCEDQAEVDRYWNALLEGGGRPQACGWLIDRFGVRGGQKKGGCEDPPLRGYSTSVMPLASASSGSTRYSISRSSSMSSSDGC